ncbi:MAG: lipid-A-disaccharide synthase [Gammaproteobacteria bacterium]|nr:lipid-A-disaccharide synthase [Gammaproteobacteria bacterium]MDH3372756.1 lipid-A-disaccharide synthase [Gammaproteobacteria bacterium]
MRIGLVAGESSGDLLGAGLIRAIKSHVPDATFEGVAGPAMVAAGCDPWEDAETLAVFGLLEPLMHIPRLLKLRRSLVKRWRTSPPDVFVGIDAPDFNLGLEKALRKSGIRTAHYVSPTIWVWRAGRIKTIRKAADRVLCILPFEKDIYDQQGIDAVFVGHPKADSLPAEIDVVSKRAALGLTGGLLVAVLPGSRVSEVSRLGPEFAAAAAILAAQRVQLRFVTPIASPKLRPIFEAQLAAAGVAERFTLIDGDSTDVMAAADVVFLASGTAALESALLGKPTVAAYAIGKISGMIARLIGLRNEYFTMPNLLTETPLIPEFIQQDVIPEAMAEAVAAMLDDPARRESISRRFATLRTELALGADERAASAVIELARKT